MNDCNIMGGFNWAMGKTLFGLTVLAVGGAICAVVFGCLWLHYKWTERKKK